MADYPATIYTPREVENLPGVVYDAAKTENLYAEDLNDSNAEIVAIEETLGENPQGSYDTVAERLDALGPGGGGEWGDITGDIHDQTDLMDEFDDVYNYVDIELDDKQDMLPNALLMKMSPAYPTSASGGTRSPSNVTQMSVAMFEIYAPILVRAIRIRTGSASGSGGMDAAIYTSDGATRLALGSLGTMVGSTNYELVFGTPVQLYPGPYYLALITKSSQSAALQYFTDIATYTATAESAYGFQNLRGRINVTGGALPSSFSPAGLTPTGDGFIPMGFFVS